MSEFTKVVVVGDHKVHTTDKEKKEVVLTAADGITEVPSEKFAELEALGAVREPTKDDRDRLKTEPKAVPEGAAGVASPAVSDSAPANKK